MNSDFKELLNLFAKYDVRYLIVGGYAVMKYSEPRFTKDVDLWISTDADNAQAVYSALREFGAPLRGLKAEDFMDGSSFYQMGRAPLRVDVMMSIPGVDFDTCWNSRIIVEIDDMRMPFISKADLVTAKQASGRPQDLLDVQRLLETDDDAE